MTTTPHGIRHFQIALSKTTAELPWTSREPLLRRVRKVDGGLAVVMAFENVGATRPVKLDREGNRLLLEVVSFWIGQQPGYDRLPAGITELRDELENERADGEL